MNENRLEKLDNAFLFIVSFVGLLITIVQVSIFRKTDISNLVEISPLLFLGMLLPFYIGYLRGAISIVFVNRSIVERMRGWVYLIMGVSGYFGFVLSSGQTNLINMWTILYSLGAAGVALTFVLQRWFIGVFDVGAKISHQYSLFGTIASGFLLSFVLRMLVSIYSDLSALPLFSPYVMFLVFIFFLITWCVAMACLVLEKVSRDVINTEHFLDTQLMQKRRRRNFLVKLFLLNIDIYYLVLLVCTRARTSRALQARVAWLLGVIFAILGFCSFAIPLFTEGLLGTSIFLFGLGTYYFWKMRIDFSELGHIWKSAQKRALFTHN